MYTREELHAEAERLGIDISNLPWPEQVKRVNQAKQTISDTDPRTIPEEQSQSNLQQEQRLRELEAKIARQQEEIMSMRKKYEDYEPGSVPTGEDYQKNPIMIAPEMTPHKVDANLSRYSNVEKIGDGLDIEEVSYTLDDLPKDREAKLHGSYHIKGRTNRVVTAFSRGPRTQAGQYLQPKEYFKEVTYNGMKAYQWAHVRAVLKTISGGRYIKKYHDEIAENMMPIGQQNGIQKEFVDQLFSQIRDEEIMRQERGF